MKNSFSNFYRYPKKFSSVDQGIFSRGISTLISLAKVERLSCVLPIAICKSPFRFHFFEKKKKIDMQFLLTFFKDILCSHLLKDICKKFQWYIFASLFGVKKINKQKKHRNKSCNVASHFSTYVIDRAILRADFWDLYTIFFKVVLILFQIF